MTRRGFVLGKFMPPHAGHVWLCRTARAMVDELTILVCWLPGDPVDGGQRLGWMRELFPDCRVIGHGDPIPQAPEEHPDFWPLWIDAIRRVHPEPVDYVFAGEVYGLELARRLGAQFIPVMRGDFPGGRSLSGTAVREDRFGQWRWLPAPVKRDWALRICLHGVESTGKSVLTPKLAAHFDTVMVPEYGRYHCEVHGLDFDASGLMTIGRVQQAMIDAAAPEANRLLIADTDALMTAAWHEMLFGPAPAELLNYRKADLYLLFDADVPWVDDGTRFFGTDGERGRFAALCRDMLDRCGVNYCLISGDWAAREQAAVAAINALLSDR